MSLFKDQMTSVTRVKAVWTNKTVGLFFLSVFWANPMILVTRLKFSSDDG